MPNSNNATWLFTACLIAGSPPMAGAVQPPPTPELRRFESVPVSDGWGYVTSAALVGTDQNVGMALACQGGEPTVSVTLGSFPADLRPVQLAVRTASGRVERFGQVLQHAGPRSGFHSPALSDPNDVRRFLDAALEPGALVSNGFNSFWLRMPPAENERLRAQVQSCGR